jgi:L-alanine-DL-glutamate epimerase-like enolase superfamily enzyme
MAASTRIRVEDLSYAYDEFHYRTPIKFGGVSVDRSTILNVCCTARTSEGRAAEGFGSMPLGNVWAFPSKLMSFDATLTAMKALVEQIAQISADCEEFGHPIDLNHTLEPAYIGAAADLTTRLGLPEPIPVLVALVAASPFDAAVHDAFGKALGLNCYYTYGPDFLKHDLGHYLGAEFGGEQLDQYILKDPQLRLPLYHLVGALDPIEPDDLERPIGDGFPETLAEWIRRDGLTHLKIKLNGDDLDWDVERVVRIERVTASTQLERGGTKWVYSLDFNERCPNVDYLLEFLRQVNEKTPAAFDRIQYIEQPTSRDLKASRHNTMHEASKLKPVVIDESLIDLESLLLARDMGYTGVALKACKGQSQSLLMAAAAQKYGMFLCVQDLTCPGASLIHSAGLAAHVPGVAAIEANARQYMPEANEPWAERFPGIFRVADGMMNTGILTGSGLGAVE